VEFVPGPQQGNQARTMAFQQARCFSAPMTADMLFLIGDQEEIIRATQYIEKEVANGGLVYVLLVNNKKSAEEWPDQLRQLKKRIDLIIPFPRTAVQFGSGVNILCNQNEAVLWFLRGICEIMTIRGLICVDYADIKIITQNGGKAVSLYTTSASGETRAQEALNQLASLLEPHQNIFGNPLRCCVTIFGGLDFSLDEFDIVSSGIENLMVNGGASLVGTAIIPDLEGTLRISALFCDSNEELQRNRC
jgi:cell division GTPase FtsZ